MCDHHIFCFDENKAYEDQLLSVLRASPEHPVSQSGAPSQPGVYVLFRKGVPVFAGKAKDLRSRLKDYSKRTATRKGIDVQEVTCRFLTIENRRVYLGQARESLPS
jgi:hypothetical protein